MLKKASITIILCLLLMFSFGCMKRINEKVGEVSFTPDKKWGIETVALIRTFTVGEKEKKRTEVRKLSIEEVNPIPKDTTGLYLLVRVATRDTVKHRVVCDFTVDYRGGYAPTRVTSVHYEGSGNAMKHRIDCLQDIDKKRSAEVTLVVNVVDNSGGVIFTLQPVRYITPVFIPSLSEKK